MRLIIQQNNKRLKIYVDTTEKVVYYGQYFTNWRKGERIEIRDENDKLCLKIETYNIKILQFSWNVVYNFNLVHLNKSYLLKCIAFRKRHWRMETEDGYLDYFEHHGHLKSVFRNDTQIARIDKEKLSLFENNRTFIDFKGSEIESELILIGLALVFEQGRDNGGATFTIDFGNFDGSETRNYDTKWSPD